MLKQPLYFDNASTTPILPEAKEELLRYLGDNFGNAGSLHSLGQEAVRALDKSREVIANSLRANFRQIIFTSSATEANNLAIKGVFEEKKNISNPRIIISAIEHESVLESAMSLERLGAEIIVLPVDNLGYVKKEPLFEYLNERTILVSLMHGNNETGVIQPIKDLARIVKAFDKKILFHTDAAQSFPYVDCSPDELGVDMLTISSHKSYGPKGAAALYLREESMIHPIIHGGGQEFGLRSGTENVAAIAGFAKAVEMLMPEREKNRKRIRDLAFYFFESLKDFTDIEINGPFFKVERLPHIINIYFHEQKAEELLLKLDQAQICASAGSACRSRAIQKSHVLSAMGLSEGRIEKSLRFSFGIFNSIENIKDSMERMKKIV